MACEFPSRCGNLANCYTLVTYLLTPVTVTLVIISFPSPTLSFVPDLKPSFSANPSHCSLSSSSQLTTRFPRLLLLLVTYLFLLFSFSVLQFLVVVSVR